MLNKEYFRLFSSGSFDTLDLKLGVLLVDFCFEGESFCVLPAKNFSLEEVAELRKRGFKVEFLEKDLKISW